MEPDRGAAPKHTASNQTRGGGNGGVDHVTLKRLHDTEGEEDVEGES